MRRMTMRMVRKWRRRRRRRRRSKRKRKGNRNGEHEWKVKRNRNRSSYDRCREFTIASNLVQLLLSLLLALMPMDPLAALPILSWGCWRNQIGAMADHNKRRST